MPLRDPQTPFDSRRVAPAKLDVVVGPRALEEASDEWLQRLVSISTYSFVNVSGVVANEPSGQRLKDIGIQPVVVREANEVIGLSTPKTARFLAYLHQYRRLADREPDESVVLEKLLAENGDLYDLCVVASSSLDPRSIRQQRWRLCDLPGLLTRLRLYLVFKDHFEEGPNHFIDKGLYLLIRKARMFPEFRPAWRTVLALGEPRLVEEQLTSLSTRLQYLCQAQDLVLISCLRTPDRSSVSDCLYHLTSLIAPSDGRA